MPMNADPKFDENELLQKVACGDEKAFTELFYSWKDHLYYFTLKFTESPQQAEDLVQDVFLKLWINRNTL